MEKNERLAWRTKPRTYCRCFSSCPKRRCKGDPSNCKLEKHNFSGPEKLFFNFPFQTLLGPGTKLFRCFSSFPMRRCKGRPFQLQIRKNNFSGPEKLFFNFPFQTLLGPGTFRCFSSFPKRHCKGRPFQLQIRKTQLFRPRKVVFLFSLPDTLGTRHSAFQVLFQLPKAPLQRETLPIAN